MGQIAEGPSQMLPVTPVTLLSHSVKCWVWQSEAVRTGLSDALFYCMKCHCHQWVTVTLCSHCPNHQCHPIMSQCQCDHFGTHLLQKSLDNVHGQCSQCCGHFCSQQSNHNNLICLSLFTISLNVSLQLWPFWYMTVVLSWSWPFSIPFWLVPTQSQWWLSLVHSGTRECHSDRRHNSLKIIPFPITRSTVVLIRHSLLTNSTLNSFRRCLRAYVYFLVGTNMLIAGIHKGSHVTTQQYSVRGGVGRW